MRLQPVRPLSTARLREAEDASPAAAATTASSTPAPHEYPQADDDVGRPPKGDEQSGKATFARERPSKTRLKQASHALQDLGEAVVALPDERLRNLAISERLLDAIQQYKKTRTHEGKRRQMQYIGKLMRIDEIEPIRRAVADLQLGRAQDSLALHQAERWRAELLADDEAATRWISAQPQTDVQQLRSLIRAARKDAALLPDKRSGRAYRELFQFIRQHPDE